MNIQKSQFTLEHIACRLVEWLDVGSEFNATLNHSRSNSMPISYRAAQTLIKRGDEATLRTALDQHLDPNLSNSNGWSLLMLAAVEGNVPIGRLLLERGALSTTQNSTHETALSIATHRSNDLFVALLHEFA